MKGKLFCEHGTIDNVDQNLIMATKGIENELGYELEVTSGYRCPDCNKADGGVPDSAHVKGKAFDVSISDSVQRFNIIRKLILRGIVRFGIGKNFIHFDIDKENPQNVVWHYYG